MTWEQRAAAPEVAPRPGAAAWERLDRWEYNILTSSNIGQISGDGMAKEIMRLAADKSNKTFLEIGTWNGLGSTRAFVESLKKRTDDYVFYSLECNSDKCADAAKLYKDYPKVHILNEVLFNQEPDIVKVFPHIKNDNTALYWNFFDVDNMKRCNLFLSRPNLPDRFDVVLLDGGEFTTYFEYQLLKDRCKIIMLDDIATDKCKLIAAEIEASPLWKIIKKDLTLRNGYLIAERNG